MDVNELARRRLASIDSDMADKLKGYREASDAGDAGRLYAEVAELRRARHQTEKLILGGPKGAALVA